MKKDGTIALKGKDIIVTGSGKINVKADGEVVTQGQQDLAELIRCRGRGTMKKPLANEVLEVIAQAPELTESDLLSRVEAQTGNAVADSSRSVPTGVVIGTYQGRNDAGDPMVAHPFDPAAAAVVARSTVSLGADDVGREIVMVFDSGDIEPADRRRTGSTTDRGGGTTGPVEDHGRLRRWRARHDRGRERSRDQVRRGEHHADARRQGPDSRYLYPEPLVRSSPYQGGISRNELAALRPARRTGHFKTLFFLRDELHPGDPSVAHGVDHKAVHDDLNRHFGEQKHARAADLRLVEADGMVAEYVRVRSGGEYELRSSRDRCTRSSR